MGGSTLQSRSLWDDKQEKQRLCFGWGVVWVEKRVSPLRSLQKAQTAPVEMTGFWVGREAEPTALVREVEVYGDDGGDLDWLVVDEVGVITPGTYGVFGGVA
jgi:hypothetical protein